MSELIIASLHQQLLQKDQQIQSLNKINEQYEKEILALHSIPKTKLETENILTLLIYQQRDIMFELPLRLSRSICNEWIDVYDICHIETAYGCCESKLRKIVQMLNNLLVYGLINENHAYKRRDHQTLINNRILKINLYVKWLIKNNMKVQYFNDNYLDSVIIEYLDCKYLDSVIIEYLKKDGQDIYKILCKLNHLILLKGKDNNNNLFKLFKNNQFINLRILDLTCDYNGISINSTELESIIENNLNIQELILDYHKNINDDCIMFIVENCEHLKFLSLNCCFDLNLELSDLLTKQNKNLIKLSINRCYNCTDVSLTRISKMFLNLQELSIECNKYITDQGLIVFANNCSTLLKLNIQNCEEITDIGIIEITKILKNLNSFQFGMLDYYGNYLNITDESLIAISKNCLNLNVLNITTNDRCELITYIGFNALSTTLLQNLTELYFPHCDKFNDSNVIEMSKYLTNLQVLSIIRNKNLADESIIAITKNCKNLNTLIIEDCKNITNIGFESIKNCLKLKFITISNYNISKLCLINIIIHCLKLKKLIIRDFSDNLDDSFIEILKKQNLFIIIDINSD
jgi:hypothetical protein